MSLWWLRPGWTDARCSCGAKIWPEGDPDWGSCCACFDAGLQQQDDEQPQDEAEYWADIERKEAAALAEAEGQREPAP